MTTKINTYVFLALTNLLLFKTDLFASQVREFESANVRFVPFSESSRTEIAEILTNPAYHEAPYQAGSNPEVIKAFIDKHLQAQTNTALGAWVVFEKNLNKAIGIASFKEGNVFYDAKKQEENPLAYVEAGGLRKSDNFTEIGAGKIPLHPDYVGLKTEIMDALFTHAFAAEPLLEGIAFGVIDPNEFGLNYAKEKQLPYAPAPVGQNMPYFVEGNSETPGKWMHVFNCTRDFYNTHKNLFNA